MCLFVSDFFYLAYYFWDSSKLYVWVVGYFKFLLLSRSPLWVYKHTYRHTCLFTYSPLIEIWDVFSFWLSRIKNNLCSSFSWMELLGCTYKFVRNRQIVFQRLVSSYSLSLTAFDIINHFKFFYYSVFVAISYYDFNSHSLDD